MGLRLNAMEAFRAHLLVVPVGVLAHYICVVNDYERGYAEGYAAREAEFEGLQRVADYWYFRALNPSAKPPEQKMIDSIIDGMEANEARAKRYAELDAEEQERFQQARALIAEGYSNIAVAVKVGLFLPIVENLRAGVL